jgi:16S rRNA (guanine966-N2)-methyltransferase
MRIIAGTLRGRRISCPAGFSLRPTSDRLKESLFNILAPRLPGSLFLDLFAGIGAIGLEAYSRGAAKVILVEKEKRSLQCIRANMAQCGLTNELRILPLPVVHALAQLSSEAICFDLIFLDPPYQQTELYRETLEGIGEQRLLKEEGLVIAEHPSRYALGEGFSRLSRIRQHRVGDTCLSFFQRNER